MWEEPPEYGPGLIQQKTVRRATALTVLCFLTAGILCATTSGLCCQACHGKLKCHFKLQAELNLSLHSFCTVFCHSSEAGNYYGNSYSNNNSHEDGVSQNAEFHRRVNTAAPLLITDRGQSNSLPFERVGSKIE